MKNRYAWMAFALVIVAGCADEPVTLHQKQSPEKFERSKLAAEAGVPPKVEPFDHKKEADARGDISRPDPFALTSEERTFETGQRAANLLASNGGWYATLYEEPAPSDEETGLVPIEPQPDRRLAGIMVGDTVSALIDMGDGSGIKLVRPGQVIEPQREWTVFSIDEEKAILRRNNKRLRPEFVVVRLGPNLAGGTPGGAPVGGPQGDDEGAFGGPSRPSAPPRGGGGGIGADDK